MDENAKGRQHFLAMRAKASAHLIEKVGSELRKMMPWISTSKEEVTAAAGGGKGVGMKRS